VLIAKEIPIGANMNKSFLKKLCPGLMPGAADDDPSGIATFPSRGSVWFKHLMGNHLYLSVNVYNSND